MKNEERLKGGRYSYGQLYNAFINYMEETYNYIQTCIDMRTGNQLLGNAKPKWTDPLSSDERTKNDERKSAFSTQQFTKLQNFLAKKAEEEKFTSQDANTVKQMVEKFFSTGNPKKSTKSVLNTDDDSKATKSNLM